jgi:hypothetical protein
MVRLTPADIPAYLHFGYLPKCQTGTTVVLDRLRLHLDTRRQVQEEAALVKQGTAVLHNALRQSVEKAGKEKIHILPLSGGLDSRAILGGLLENVDRTNIQAVTFGTPGTWDYEIGQQVAQAAGVRCEAVDLTAADWRWDMDGLRETAVQIETPTWLFDAYVNRHIPQRFGIEAVYWSGFMGDPLAGSHLLPTDSADWEQARSQFVKRNQFARSMRLSPPDFVAENTLPDEPLLPVDLLSYDEQLDFAIRQRCLISHIVLPEGYDYQTPFLHPEWVEFILNAPRQYRAELKLYKRILQAAYPTLFALPTKTNNGLPLRAPRWRQVVQTNKLRVRHRVRRYMPWINLGVPPQTNYIDFDDSLRHRADLQQLVYENIRALNKRGVVDWLDLEALWQRHQKRQADYADALRLLASLEIYLRGGETAV